MSLGGNLHRAAEGADKELDGSRNLSAGTNAPMHSKELSEWLGTVRGEGANFTVLIAGGDLVIEAGAEIVVNTPLLLVAGGTVRVEGKVHVSSGRVFVLGDGGGINIVPTKETATVLTMDPPREKNPLLAELHYAVLSNPLPPRGVVTAWKHPESGGVAGPGSRWSVRYVREIGAMPATIAELQPVDDPIALEPAGPIQVLIELWVGPGASFEPPSVDFVHLQWDQRVAGRSH
jgi:hypothetical protein